MAREPVAIDFIGLAGMAERGVGRPGECDERGSRGRSTTLVRPILTVPDYFSGASRMSPAPEGFRSRDNSLLTRPHGLCRSPWAHKHPRSENNSGVTVVSSLASEARSVGPGPLSAWDHSAPASPSHHPMGTSNRFEDFVLAQQARTAASMYVNVDVNPLQTLRNVPIAVARTSPLGDEAQPGTHQSDLELTSVSHQQHPSSSHSTGFGSPVPMYRGMKGNSSGAENGVPIVGQSPPRQQPQHPAQGANVAAAHALQSRPSGTGKRPRTAQLTIFYAGAVNVYDDVPFDKAQAIMLLAGSGSTWSSSNYRNLPGSCGAPGRPFSTPSAMSQPTSRAGSPAPQMTTTSAGPPPPPGSVPQAKRQPPTGLIAELPQARKASLARFLEKRKDRVRRGPYTIPRNDELVRNDEIIVRNRENSPSPSSSRPPTPLSGNHNNVAGAGGAVHEQGASTSASEPNSPPQTPPRQSMLEDTSHGMPERTKCENIKELTVGHSGKPSPSRGDVDVTNSGAEAMDEHLS